MILNCVGLLRVLWIARRSNQSILKEISPEYSLEGLMLKLKLQFFGHLIRRADSFEKTMMKRKIEKKNKKKDWRQEEKGTTEDEMAGWHHRLDGHEFEQTPAVGDGQESLACCSPWDRKESDTTEWLNWTEEAYYLHQSFPKIKVICRATCSWWSQLPVSASYHHWCLEWSDQLKCEANELQCHQISKNQPINYIHIVYMCCVCSAQ